MISHARPSSTMLRWFTLGAAGGAAVTMALHMLGMEGPWLSFALVLALLAVFASIAVFYHLRIREKELLEAQERAQRDEQVLGELHRELERHAQLELEMRQAKQAADSAAMAKGEFLATMSHEIRTPLNGIVPMLDLLMHARLAPDHAELVRTAYLSSQQMLRIVDDILDYSKLEADKLELETTAFNLRELLEGVLQLMERPAQSKGLRLHMQLDAGVRLPVRGDPVRLRQVLGNLISNAVKFTERGSVTVSLRKTGETAAQHQLRFEVRDTGIGISQAAQSRLFQAFSQADASTTRLYGGTGLGLAISKRIVDLMGGRIGVESEPGAGATFWFEVPLLKVQGDMQAEDKSPQDGRLLLLSADPRLRLRLSMLLPNWGLRVTSVETTQEALDRLRTAANQGPPWSYSIVLADLAGMRNTALALHRNLGRQAVYGDLRLVCLYGDDPVAEELQRSVTLLSRQSPDANLRAALFEQTGEATAAPAAAASDVEEPAVPTPPPTTVDKLAVRKPRVLLVEDNPVNLMVGQRLLGVLGITCDTASNGEAALLRMSASRYDIVLMDCQMPVMDGYTATQRWRENEEASGDGRRLPIIAMTANAMAGDRQKCLDAGMDDYLPKPVTRSELERCLHRWWDPDQISVPAEFADLVGAATPQAEAATPTGLDPQLLGLPTTETAPAPQAAASATGTGGAEAQASPAPVDAPSAAPPPTTPTPASMPAPPAGPAPAPAATVQPTPVATATPPASANAGSPPAGAPEPPKRPLALVLDTDILDDLQAMLGEEVDRLIDVFLDDTPRLIKALENAAAGPDYDALRDAAHSLKSSAANLGAMSLSAAAKRVELAAREKSLERPAVAVALIANEFARARQQMLARRPAQQA
ncbi:hybrid sensor histidine kinase/response regulator [Luteimonas marina]|nr:hybrid sensor histidine kinase/response regulator [Luteimonas marina]